jgi:hypothetical protein
MPGFTIILRKPIRFHFSQGVDHTLPTLTLITCLAHLKRRIFTAKLVEPGHMVQAALVEAV